MHDAQMQSNTFVPLWYLTIFQQVLVGSKPVLVVFELVLEVLGVSILPTKNPMTKQIQHKPIVNVSISFAEFGIKQL